MSTQFDDLIAAAGIVAGKQQYDQKVPDVFFSNLIANLSDPLASFKANNNNNNNANGFSTAKFYIGETETKFYTDNSSNNNSSNGYCYNQLKLDLTSNGQNFVRFDSTGYESPLSPLSPNDENNNNNQQQQQQYQTNRIAASGGVEHHQNKSLVNHATKRVLCDDDFQVTNRLCKKSRPILTYREMNEFYNLLDSDGIKKFLDSDRCYLVTDKYMLAMVFTYFKRANFGVADYTKLNFFLALYLANDIEEDVDEYKYEILPWALGSDKWRGRFLKFLKKRDQFLKTIDYRAFVSRKNLEEVMIKAPDHPIWKRTRSADHGGATRSYLIRKADLANGSEPFIENDLLLPRGPDYPPRKCPLCTLYRPKTRRNSNSQKQQQQQQQQAQAAVENNQTDDDDDEEDDDDDNEQAENDKNDETYKANCSSSADEN